MSNSSLTDTDKPQASFTNKQHAEHPPSGGGIGFIQTFYLDIHNGTVMFNFYLAPSASLNKDNNP
ncbi:MAG: hypothetical protein GX295_09490 [Syntrophomonadaceae bacterium]|nr:hypothetical protein [Syntrophomonadaceae bacterium]